MLWRQKDRYEVLDVIGPDEYHERVANNPEVFLLGASKIGVPPENCVVFEDSLAGIQAAKRAGFFAVGIGRKEDLPGADVHIGGLYEMLPFKMQLTL